MQEQDLPVEKPCQSRRPVSDVSRRQIPTLGGGGRKGDLGAENSLRTIYLPLQLAKGNLIHDWDLYLLGKHRAAFRNTVLITLHNGKEARGANLASHDLEAPPEVFDCYGGEKPKISL